MPIAEENQFVNIVLPRTRVQEIEELARAEQRTRSAFLQILIIECLEHRKRAASSVQSATPATTS
jgi:hypothetical protein